MIDLQSTENVRQKDQKVNMICVGYEANAALDDETNKIDRQSVTAVSTTTRSRIRYITLSSKIDKLADRCGQRRRRELVGAKPRISLFVRDLQATEDHDSYIRSSFLPS